jgi:hypothetical protein
MGFRSLQIFKLTRCHSSSETLCRSSSVRSQAAFRLSRSLAGEGPGGLAVRAAGQTDVDEAALNTKQRPLPLARRNAVARSLKSEEVGARSKPLHEICYRGRTNTQCVR